MRLCENFLGKTVVTAEGEKLGKLYDIIVDPKHVFPKIDFIVVRARRRNSERISLRKIIRSVKLGRKSFLYIPWKYVDEVERKRILLRVNAERLEEMWDEFSEFKNAKKKYSLVKDVLDEQVVDSDGRFIDRVDDVKIEQVGRTLRVIGLDIGIEGVLERLGFERILKNIGIKLPEKMIPWYLVKLSKRARRIQLKVPGEIL
ncbi:PRC-barrel domain-containing protein [Candidatus Hecatella orcuttiae]|uniref:PRC-barrel domain-containing protein n=1 Tax=Candidatus Hecatella orcuttiae TaxID=1935119 RepID=UPI002867B164|nr:PRC-barrel domain-containing protein [Candidatus Hecatella orcuttiae]